MKEQIRNKDEAKKRGEKYMLTTWQEEVEKEEQSQVTLLSNPSPASNFIQFPFPLHGSTPKSQSFFPSLPSICFNAFAAN